MDALVGTSETATKREPANLHSNRGQGIDPWKELQPLTRLASLAPFPTAPAAARLLLAIATLLVITTAQGNARWATYRVTFEGKFSNEPIATLTFARQSATPVITSAATFTVKEETTRVETLTATDQDSAAADLEWSKAGGADAGQFTLSSGGALAFEAAPDYENPDDSDADRTYEVTVQVTDGDNPVTADILVTLENVIELATEVTGQAAVSYAENGATRVATYIASSEEDRDGIAWILGGDDKEHFSIDNPAGVLRFHIDPDADNSFPKLPDYELPDDKDANNAYAVTVLAQAGSAFTSLSVTVTVTDENEAGAISLTTARPKAGSVLTATLTDPDGVTAGTVAWQWERSAGRNVWVVIDGATEASYMPTAADTGAYLRVTATYDDEHGLDHSVEKVASNVVTGPLLTTLRVTTGAATGDTTREMKPAFAPETLHYAIGCNGSDTMQADLARTLERPCGGRREGTERELHRRYDCNGRGDPNERCANQRDRPQRRPHRLPRPLPQCQVLRDRGGPV